jgi:transposase
VNVLKPHKKSAVLTLLARGVSQHKIHELTGVDRKTVRDLDRARRAPPDLISNSPRVATGSGDEIPPPRPPDGGASGTAELRPIPERARSACEPHREWIEAQVRLQRNAYAIYQDLVDRHDFKAKYNSVKRFVRALKCRDPDQFDRLEFLPGEEAQVDYGEGAPTLDPKTGRYRRPRLFVMTLRYSRRSFRKVVWKSSTQTWCRLHEEAFRYFGGCPEYVVLDNLKEGVIKPDIYEPELNRVYAAMLAHYGVTADPTRVRDPDRKGTVENAIQHTQSTALKGRRFESIEEQNEFLRHWEEKWAAPRIHGRAKRQVEAMFQEEKPFLKGLPVAPFRYFVDGTRTVCDDTTITVDGASYAARPAPIGSQVLVRVYDLEIEVRDLRTQELIRVHPRAAPGSLRLPEHERPFNPSRQTHYLLAQAEAVGPRTHELCLKLFEKQGRVSQKSMWGILGVARKYPARIAEQACEIALARGVRSSREVRAIADTVFAEALAKVEAHGAATSVPAESSLTQHDPLIRDAAEYDEFFNRAARAAATAHNPKEEMTNDDDHARDGANPTAAPALRSPSDAGDPCAAGPGLQSGLFGDLLADPAGRARSAALAADRAQIYPFRPRREADAAGV